MQELKGSDQGVTGRLLAELDGHLEAYVTKIHTCVGLLSEEQVWWRPGPRSNSIGNVILHLCGNLSQWVLAGVGGEAFERRRALEFAADRSLDAGQLMARLTDVVGRCRALLPGLPDAALLTRHRIQGYDTDGLGVLVHVVEHMSYHTGQVVFITKQLVGEQAPIEFYPQHRNE
jgi:uncharacterized damage-inducible protein DinB